MPVFLPLRTNYHLHYEENEINDLVEEQGELFFRDYEKKVCTILYIIEFFLDYYYNLNINFLRSLIFVFVRLVKNL